MIRRGSPPPTLLAPPTEAAEKPAVFYLGYGPADTWFHLVDRAGRKLWTWKVPENLQKRATKLTGETLPLMDIQGAALLESGDIVFTFAKNFLVRMDRCSRPKWVLQKPVHHSVFADSDGAFWVPARLEHLRSEHTGLQPPYREDFILKVSPDGDVQETISLLDAAEDSDHHALYLGGEEKDTTTYRKDPLHLNDVQILSEKQAAAHPAFEAGDLFISLKAVDALAVLDGKTHRFKWVLTGPFLRQHDPEIGADGLLYVFDNRAERALYQFETAPEAGAFGSPAYWS